MTFNISKSKKLWKEKLQLVPGLRGEFSVEGTEKAAQLPFHFQLDE